MDTLLSRETTLWTVEMQAVRKLLSHGELRESTTIGHDSRLATAAMVRVIRAELLAEIRKYR
jgi:hypothetical protein